MVVPVLITSCHVSEYLNTGPVTAQTSTTRTARKNAVDDPIAIAKSRANFRKLSLIVTALLHPAELRVERPQFPLVPCGRQATNGRPVRRDRSVPRSAPQACLAPR